MGFISDLITNVSAFRIKIGEKLNKLWLDIGNKANLTTTHKTDLVGAINEVNQKQSDVKIGGRNLAINSTSLDALPLYGVTGDYEVVSNASLPSKKYFRLTNIVRTIGNLVFYIPFGNRPDLYSYSLNGVPLTISFFIRTNNTQFFTATGVNVNSVFQKIELQFTWWGSGNLHFDLVGAGLSFVEIHSLKIEVGTKATDWTPSIEDQVTDWNQNDSTKFDFIKNKPTSFPTNSNLQQVATNGNITDKGLRLLYPEVGFPTLSSYKHGIVQFNGSNLLFGSRIGVEESGGDTWWQAQRYDSSLAYNILLQPAGGSVGIGTTSPNHKLEVNGNVGIIGTVYTASHGTSADWFSRLRDLGGAYGLGFSGGNIDEPYIQSTGGVNAILATRNWVTNNFASNTVLGNYTLTNGSNTIGGHWSIDGASAPTLTTTVKQVYQAVGAQIYFGNPQLSVLTFESVNGLLHYRNGLYGEVWTSHNFNPANYAILSQVYTQAQSLGLFVGKTGVETIQDTKTFTHSPIVPNGTLSGHAVNKSQLDAISASIPNAPNNGTFTVQGTGSLTGSGSTSADASANTTADLDLTPATKTDIKQGTEAKTQVTSLFADAVEYFKYNDATVNSSIDTNEAFFNLVNPKTTSGLTIDIGDHYINGARLVLQSVVGFGGIVTYKGRFIMRNHTLLGTLTIEGEIDQEFVWDANENRWREVF